MRWMEQLDVFHKCGGKSNSFFQQVCLECKDKVRSHVDDEALSYSCFHLVTYLLLNNYYGSCIGCLSIIYHKHSISLLTGLYFLLYLYLFFMCRAMIGWEANLTILWSSRGVSGHLFMSAEAVQIFRLRNFGEEMNGTYPIYFFQFWKKKLFSFERRNYPTWFICRLCMSLEALVYL
jgi:hypothetical protein